jgi:glycosyltransferase involved in cell wall biosynthesis
VGSTSLKIAQIAGVGFRVPPRAAGGTELVIHLLTRGLAERGHRVTLFASGDSSAPCQLQSVVPFATRDDPSSNLYLEREFDLRNVDEVYSRSAEFDVIHAHWPTPAPYFSERARCPTLLTFDYIEKEIFEHYRAHVPRLSFACVSRAQAAMLGGGLPVVHNGIDLEQVPFSQAPRNYVLTVGRLVPSKGASLAIEVARRAGIPLVIVGAVSPDLPGSREYYEREIAPRVDGNRVCHYPELPNRRVLELMSEARAFLFPISWEEPFGMVVAEAMASGAPVVATPRGSLPELVVPGVTGFLEETVEGLADAVLRSAALDRRACRQRARDLFDFRRMAEQYEAIYERLLEGRPAQELVALAGR